MTYSYGFYFGQPWWLAACVLLVPMVWLARRSLGPLGPWRRSLAIVLRCVVMLILIALLARPILARKSRRLTLIAVLDRSQSIPAHLQEAGLRYLETALEGKPEQDQLAIVDVAETASISVLPSIKVDEIRRRNTTLAGHQSNLAAGIQMAMAIAPPDTAVRILLLSEGNETVGNLREVARLAAANGIPIDVLPLRYRYENEVVFRRLAGPARARSGQTVSLRFVLKSTSHSTGKLMLNLNGSPVDLAPGSPEVAVPVELKPGTNVRAVSVPVGARGVHEFEAVFLPDDPNQDRIAQNNRASAMTYVLGPGHVVVVDTDGTASTDLQQALKDSDIDVRYVPAPDFPDNLARLMDADVIILVNTDCASFTYQQQELLCRYVNDLGGGLIMVGGPQAFGAGGWIGSPVAEILPVELDPPQKKQMPRGALVMIMHACEMPQGNYWGKQVAITAVKALSRDDLVGVLAYNWQGAGDWVYPLSRLGDREAVISAIQQMIMGDMPSLQDHLLQAYNALTACQAGTKHVIVISDGDPQPPTDQLLGQCKDAGITVTGVAVFPHNPSDVQSLMRIAQATGGRFYNVTDPAALPKIFIKEAQVVRRSFIVERSFTPAVAYSLSEIIGGLSRGLPQLDGYILTGPKGGLNQLILVSPEAGQADPILASCQSGLGRCVAFTSSADSRWAGKWLAWGGFERFWEQAVRWAAKPAQSTECEVLADVHGQEVSITVEAVDAEGKFIQFAAIDGQVIAPDASSLPLELTQLGPGQYQGRFVGAEAGSYIVNLRYRKLGDDATTHIAQTTINIPFAPEFRDLSDNAPLMAELSGLTGGRILPSDPNQAFLYDHAGLKFPAAQLPLTRPLMFLWLALFLLDVAVRRVVVDFRAALRKVASVVRRTRGRAKADETIERLKLRRAKLRRRLSPRKGDSLAAARYQAQEPHKAGDLPIAKVAETPSGATEAKPQKPRAPRAEVQQDSAHIERLLRAKRRAAETKDTDADSGKP